MSSLPQNPPRPQYSFALTTYFDAEHIELFHERLTSTLSLMHCSYEVIYVNDGSTDNTYAKLEELFERDPHVVHIVDLVKNVGQIKALAAAFSYCRGERVVVLDTDLQLAPEDFPRLAELSEQGYDLVSAYRTNRAESWVRVGGSLLFNFLMRQVSDLRYRDFGCTFKIFDGKIVRAFEFGPRRPLAVVALMGAARSYAEVPVQHAPRAHGESGWTMRQLFASFVERLITSSPAPFHILGGLSLFVAVALVALNALILGGMGGEWTIEGRMLWLTNLQVGGFVLLAAFLSIAGDLAARIFLALNNSPAYIIRQHRSREEAQGEGVLDSRTKCNP